MTRRDVLVVAELARGKIRRATLSAVSFGRQAARILGGTLSILVLGTAASEAAHELAPYADGEILLCEAPELATALAETCTPTIASVGSSFGLVVATATSLGKDVMPRVAARLDAGYAADCLAVLPDTRSAGTRLLFERALFAGHVRGQCSLETAIGVATVRQSEVAPAQPGPVPAAIRGVPFAPAAKAGSRIEVIGFEPVTGDRPELTEARVVVGGGRGLKDRFFEVLEPLAQELGAAIGSTRAACDAGYAPGDFQVGQTGKIVAPELYLAVGISGAIQHIAGIRGARVIAAINNAPDAPILEVSDYALVADLFEAVPELVRCLRARRPRHST